MKLLPSIRKKIYSYVVELNSWHYRAFCGCDIARNVQISRRATIERMFIYKMFIFNGLYA